MGVEFENEKVDIYGMEDGYFSDSEIIVHVQDALKAVSLGDRERYDQLNEVMDPTVNTGPDYEALLVTTLRALLGAVSYIDVVHHQSLYSSILGMSVWNYRPIVRDALLELVTCLAASSGMFLDVCLDMLVCNFIPPQNLEGSLGDSRWLARKEEVVARVLAALQDIAILVPLTPMRLLPMIQRRMPHKHAPKKVIVIYVECMLRLESSAIGEFVGSSLLKAVVDRLIDLDVDIRWEDILQEDCSKGIFDLELEDVEENTDCEKISKLSEEAEDVLKGNAIAEKLDSLMVITCEHIKSCADNGRLLKVFETLIESFMKTVLPAYKSKFAQFVMFYACSLDADNCGVRFAGFLTDTFLSRTGPPLYRMSVVAYLASYLSRAKFLTTSLVAEIVGRLVDWCSEYCQLLDSEEKAINPKSHRVFYSGCQAVMYILCFRMRSMMDVPHLKSLLFHYPMEPILRHTLDPLKVCLPSIVQEFLQQAKAAHLFTTSTTFLFDSLLGSELSKAFGGIERLDMFFPFDPYMLKESDRFIRPNFEFWSTVRTAYGVYSSEDEDLDEDIKYGQDGGIFDEPDLVNDVESLDGGGSPDLHNEDDDIEYSMNKMSKFPKSSLVYQQNGNIRMLTRMPAKIRPSMSPDW